MAEINLPQSEADALIAMPKVRVNEQEHDFPPLLQSLVIPLSSQDRREAFVLDIHSGRINLSKLTMQNRGRQVVVLVRLDLGGPPHRNPDGIEVPCPHLHKYQEGFGDKWATPAPAQHFPDLSDYWRTLRDFMEYCSIVEPPIFRRGMFS
ncbi:MAG TPA: hypothetical protein VMV10_26010 [Pirellulales bacterium]|nr:hypothetical protein [Pirellulales bacterium]